MAIGGLAGLIGVTRLFFVEAEPSAAATEEAESPSVVTPELVREWGRVADDVNAPSDARWAAFRSSLHWLRDWTDPGPPADHPAPDETYVELAYNVLVQAPYPGWFVGHEDAEPLPWAELALERCEATQNGKERYVVLLEELAAQFVKVAEYRKVADLITEDRLQAIERERPPSGPWPFIALAKSLRGLGLLGDAARVLNRALELRETGVRGTIFCHSALSSTELARGRIDWARQHLAEIRRLVNSPEARVLTPRNRGRVEQSLLTAEMALLIELGDARAALLLWRSKGYEFPPPGRGWQDEDRPEPGWGVHELATGALRQSDPRRARELFHSFLELDGHFVPTVAFQMFAATQAVTTALDLGLIEEAERSRAHGLGLIASHPQLRESMLGVRFDAQGLRLARMRNDTAGPDALELAKTLVNELLDRWDRAGREPDGVGFLQYPFRRDVLTEAYLAVRAHESAEFAAAFLCEQVAQAQGLGSLTRALEANSFDLEHARSVLAERKEIVLTYVPGRESVFVVWVDAGGASVEVIPSLAGFRAPLEKFEREIEAVGLSRRTPVESDWRELAAAAGEALFPQRVAEAIARCDRVSIVQRELLDFAFPCAAEVPGLGLLGIERPVTYYPTLPAWQALESRAALRQSRPDGQIAALVAPRVSDERLVESGAAGDILPFAPESATQSPIAAIRREATLEAFASSLLAARCAVLWTHGVEPPSPGIGPGFEVAPSPAVPSSVAFANDLRAVITDGSLPPLCLLGICRAQHHSRRAGDDAGPGLGGVFLELGADSVVIAPTDIQARSASKVLDSVLDNVEVGRSPAKALQLARRELAESEPGAHPHFWATLQLIGAGHRPLD